MSSLLSSCDSRDSSTVDSADELLDSSDDEDDDSSELESDSTGCRRCLFFAEQFRFKF